MGIGFIEICIIAIFALIFIGPQKLPEFMREMAKFFVHARRISNEVKSSLDDVIQEAERTSHEPNRIAVNPQQIQVSSPSSTPLVSTPGSPPVTAPLISSPTSSTPEIMTDANAAHINQVTYRSAFDALEL